MLGISISTRITQTTMIRTRCELHGAGFIKKRGAGLCFLRGVLIFTCCEEVVRDHRLFSGPLDGWCCGSAFR